jgi:hypothetical protein
MQVNKHNLYINDVLFEVFSTVDRALTAFKDWRAQGYNVRVAFNVGVPTPAGY